MEIARYVTENAKGILKLICYSDTTIRTPDFAKIAGTTLYFQDFGLKNRQKRNQ